MPGKRAGIVALLTDFGTVDPFVGVMKGVILSVHPRCRLVDISHQIPPGDVREAAYALRSTLDYFPTGTVFLCVVDPGVGSSRRAIAAEGGGRLFVAPDNGLLTLAGPFRKVVEIKNSDLFLRPVSRTFHGRDIFAPAAAHLSRGAPLSRLGSPVLGLHLLPMPSVTRKGREVRGEVTRIDRFGNLITNLHPSDLPGKADLVIRVGRRRIPGLSGSYSEVGEGSLLAIIGSEGFLEVAVRMGSAASTLGARVGQRVTALG